MKTRLIEVRRCSQCRWCLQKNSMAIAGNCAHDKVPFTLKGNLQDVNDIPDWCPLPVAHNKPVEPSSNRLKP